MQSNILKNTGAGAPWLAIHPVSQEDSVGVAALRSVVAHMKGQIEGTAGRGPFNGVMEQVAVPQSVTFGAATVGGMLGWWAKPTQARQGPRLFTCMAAGSTGERRRRSGTSSATSL